MKSMMLLQRLDRLEASLREERNLNDKFREQLSPLESKVKLLQKELDDNISTIDRLNKKVAKLESVSTGSPSIHDRGTNIPRSCQELKSTDPTLTTGSYLIDPDGTGVGDSAITVFCDMTTGNQRIIQLIISQYNIR